MAPCWAAVRARKPGVCARLNRSFEPSEMVTPAIVLPAAFSWAIVVASLVSWVRVESEA